MGAKPRSWREEKTHTVQASTRIRIRGRRRAAKARLGDVAASVRACVCVGMEIGHLSATIALAERSSLGPKWKWMENPNALSSSSSLAPTS